MVNNTVVSWVSAHRRLPGIKLILRLLWWPLEMGYSNMGGGGVQSRSLDLRYGWESEDQGMGYNNIWEWLSGLVSRVIYKAVFTILAPVLKILRFEYRQLAHQKT